MAYGNNDNRPTINTYSAISLINNESQITGCSMSISYFNKMMVITFVINSKSFNQQQDQLKIYLSYIQAKKLADTARKMFNDPKSGMENVCIETKYGLLKISTGKEFNVDSPCISVIYITKDGTTQEIVYQTKSSYECAYNYQNGEFSKINYPMMEIETFILALEEYYKAANYAIAASVHEASLYRDNSKYEMLKAIAGKVGVRTGGNGGNGYRNYYNQPANPNTINPSKGAGFSNQTFLANEAKQNNEQFSAQSFDDFADSALSSLDDN